VDFGFQDKDSGLEKLSLRYKISCDNFQNLNLMLTTACIYRTSYSIYFFFASTIKVTYGFGKRE